MKAIQIYNYGGPEVMRLEEVPPLSPRAGQVLVKIHAAGVNPVDTYIRAGAYPLEVSFPFTPGMDAAGVVTAVGEGVVWLAKGDRVYLSGTFAGTYAEEAVCPVEAVASLPDNLTFNQGAAIGVPYATAYRALFTKARAVDKETVLVHGASGGVGSAAVQLAKNAGLTVIGSAGSERGLALVRDLGADLAVNHYDSDAGQKILAFTSGKGVNLVLEMLANRNLADDLKWLSPNGRVIVIGSRGEVKIDPRETMARDASIIGLSIVNTPVTERQKIYQALAPFFAEGKLSPVVGRIFPLNDAAAAHDAQLSPGAYGKIVLSPSGDA